MTEPLVVTKRIPADIERVYEALTDPNELSKWFFVRDDWRTEVNADVRVGGRFRIDMVTGTGEHLVSTGEYLSLQRPNQVKLTWTSYSVSDTIVTIDLEPDGDATNLPSPTKGYRRSTSSTVIPTDGPAYSPVWTK